MAVACGQCSPTQEESSSRLEVFYIALSQHAVTHASLHNSAHTHVACARTLQLLFSPVSLIALLRMSILAADPPPPSLPAHNVRIHSATILQASPRARQRSATATPPPSASAPLVLATRGQGFIYDLLPTIECP